MKGLLAEKSRIAARINEVGRFRIRTPSDHPPLPGSEIIENVYLLWVDRPA
jgi:hypothetical protein